MILLDRQSITNYGMSFGIVEFISLEKMKKYLPYWFVFQILL